GDCIRHMPVPGCPSHRRLRAFAEQYAPFGAATASRVLDCAGSTHSSCSRGAELPLAMALPSSVLPSRDSEPGFRLKNGHEVIDGDVLLIFLALTFCQLTFVRLIGEN